MRFGIRIATYRRPTGTYHLLHRCLRSIISQTYDNWKVFLVGDCYEPRTEFDELAAMIPPDKLYRDNLQTSPERSKHTGMDLWRVAGFTASQTGLKKIQEEGLVHAPIDDDDWWLPDHLETLAWGYRTFPESVFVYTKSTYRDSVLPREDIDPGYDNLPPRAYCLIHSAASWDTTRLPLLYRNVIEDGCGQVAGDAEMWDRVRDHCTAHRLKTLYIPKLTVRHDHELGSGVPEPALL